MLLDAVEGQVGGDDFRHALLDAGDVGELRFTPDAQAAVVAPRDGVLQQDLSVGEYVRDRLAEHEAERADVGAQSRFAGDVEELHILVVVDTEVQTLHVVVHLGTHHAVGHVESEAFVDLQK